MSRKKKPKYKLKCSIDSLKYIVSLCEIEGEWVFLNDYYQFKICNKTSISFYPTTKTILFQKDRKGRNEVEDMVICMAIEERVLAY